MFTILLILLPILYQLRSPFSVISMGELLLVPFIVIGFFKCLRKGKGKIRVPHGLLAFYFIPVMLIFMSIWESYFSIVSCTTVILRILYFFILIIIANDEFNVKKGIKLYFNIALWLSLYLILQVCWHYFLNGELPIPRNFPNILFADRSFITTEQYYHLYGFRPASFFLEPSWYADYFMPLICILLFNKSIANFLNDKKRIIFAAYFSVTILFTSSSLGVLYVIIAWFFFLFTSYSEMSIKNIYKVFYLLAALFAMLFVLQSEFFFITIMRFLNGASIGPRFVRGFIIFDNMNIYHQIFGVGLNNIGNYVSLNGIVTMYDEADLNYTVTLTNRLIATGIIGTMALIYFWVRQIIEKKSGIAKVLLIELLVSFVFANGEYSHEFPFVFSMILALERYSRSEYK